MDLVRSIRTFIATAESFSLSEAARSQFLTPSAVSKQLAALEAHLGVSLISRTTRGLSLTGAGKAYLPRAIAILNDISEAHDAVRSPDATPSGLLSIAAPAAFGRLHVAPAVAAFLREYPKMRIDLRLFDRQVDPVSSGADISFRIGKLSDSSFIAIKLGSTRRVLCASADYIASNAPIEEPADLARHNCLVSTLYTTRNTWHFRRGSEVAAVSVSGSLCSNNSDCLHSAALAGLGVALLGSWAVDDDLKAGRLQPMLPDWTGEVTTKPRDLYLVYPQSDRASPNTRALVGFIRQHLAASGMTLEARA